MRNFTILYLIGLLITIVLSLVAIYQYPGKMAEATGFLPLSDYWCDLYKPTTLSDKPNPGMLPAKIATLIGVFSFVFFWIAIPNYYSENKTNRIATQLLGLSAVILASFLFTSFHDYAIIIGSIFGFFAYILTIKSLNLKGKKNLAHLAILIIFLLVACNTIMYLPFVDAALPLLQKVAFITTVVWSIMVAYPILKT